MHALAYRTELLRRIGYRQTEGISYTDQEWAVLPMLHVRSFRHCAEPVYRYLVGRPGQTCDEVVRLKNFAMHFRVAERVIQAYELAKTRNLPAENLEFANNQIRFHLLMFYMTYLVASHRHLDDSELARFDQFLLETDEELYRYPATIPAMPRRFPFRFVREWRKGMTRRTFRFRLLDVGLALHGVAKGVFRAFFPSKNATGGLP